MEEKNEQVVENSNQQNAAVTQQMIGVDFIFFNKLLQNQTDYERLINIIIENLELNYKNELTIKDSSKILDYLKLINPAIEQTLNLRLKELKEEEK